jgi:hypothetical protein
LLISIRLRTADPNWNFKSMLCGPASFGFSLKCKLKGVHDLFPSEFTSQLERRLFEKDFIGFRRSKKHVGENKRFLVDARHTLAHRVYGRNLNAEKCCL